MNKDDKQRFYVIPSHLNKGKRITGFPVDEVLPAFIFFILLFIAKHQLVGIGLAVAWFMGLRALKVQYGENIVQLTVYWFGSKIISKRFFKKTPSSNRRYWIF